MISALLLSVALAGTPADSAFAAPVNAGDPAVQLWINNDRRFLAGDHAKVQVRTRDDGYLLVLHVDTEGHLRVLFPLDPRDDDFVRGGRKYEVRGRGGRESFSADSRAGRGYVYAAVSSDPYKLDGYVLGDHWDYRAISPNRLASDPEADLNDLVRQMSQGDFDYDILTYDVLDRVAYSDYSTPYYAGDYYDYGGYGSCFSCGYRPYRYRSGVSIGLFFGRPYYRGYYDPFFPAYDPFYDPFFYDPYYYPVYYRPFYPRAYYPGYNFPYDRYYGYYNAPGRRYVNPYTPYRFRGNDAALAGYRSRGFSGARSINTVYVPPRSRIIQPGATSNPIRRMVPEPRETGPATAAPDARRDGRRAESRPAVRDQPSTGTVAERGQPRGRDVEARRSARQETWPQDVSPRRSANSRGAGEATARDVTPRDVTPRDLTPRDVTPRDVTPRRAEVDRPQIERAPVAPARDPAPEARPSRREEPTRSAPPPSDDRSRGSWGGSGGGDRSADRGGGGGREGGSAPSARSWSGGGGGGGGGGQAPSGGGGRRR